MALYQVLARKYRPQTFRDVLGQDAIVTTLKNAIKMGRLAHAYLFCGSRGTGKTTLARIFAKALNCRQPTASGEPCNVCSTCKEISAGTSLDVLEIDGASHRGIDDIRQINDTVGYASSSGKYKIYLIDEVHMLTKEAFNALLKTLEEPPAKVVFLFATTEPHKVLPTILSRCQRFNLSRIPLTMIIQKLQHIAGDQGVAIDNDALRLIARHAEGGLRDAESLFDQIIAFHEGKITVDTVNDVLGIMPRETLFTLDQAGKEGKLAAAFEIAHQVFAQGKDIGQFIDSMTDHFRTLLLIKMAGNNAPFLSLSDGEREQYAASAKLYTQEQCLTILDLLVESQNQIRFQTSARIALEALLLRVMRTHQRLPIGYLVRRLSELEEAVQGTASEASMPPPLATKNALKCDNRSPNESPQVPEQLPPNVDGQPEPLPKKDRPEPIETAVKSSTSSQKMGSANSSREEKPTAVPEHSITEDPTPSAADLGRIPPSPQKQSRYDTLLRFAAVELEGTVKHKGQIAHKG